jgi:hypothetical protein
MVDLTEEPHEREGKMSEKTYKGSCFCGAVQLSVTGDPVLMGYCHCDSCRSWAAAPVNAFTLWKLDNVTVTQGQDKLDMFHKTANSHRQFCRICGGHVMTLHPSDDIVDVYAAVIPDLPFRPALHGYYSESVLAIRDGLPKFKDWPTDMGGSGETLPE